jgi:hypothetical protein
MCEAGGGKRLTQGVGTSGCLQPSGSMRGLAAWGISVLEWDWTRWVFVSMQALITLFCPLLAFGLGEYWFRISLYVYDRSRPLAPILKQRRCSQMYDVYLTCIDGDV